MEKTSFFRIHPLTILACAVTIGLFALIYWIHVTAGPSSRLFAVTVFAAVFSLLLTIRMIIMQRDLTKRKRITSELERRAIALESSLDGIAILNSDECYSFVNTAHAKIYGYSDPSELIGKTWHILYDADELTRLRDQMGNFYRDGRLRTEATGLKKDGSKFPQEISLTQIPGGGLVCTVRDLTEQKRLEGQLFQSQKMEAIGQLAGGIAHDFNNILTGILGYAGLLRLDSPGKGAEIAEHIERAAQSAQELTQKLLGFARKGKHQHIAIDLHDMLKEALTILNRTIEKNVSIRYNLSAPSPFVEGDPVQLQQIILNLAINARDAMHPDTGGTHGGLLTISTEPVTIGDGHGELKPGNYLKLEIQDTGCGIPSAIKDRIFEPFFTTKSPGRGTGMGLAMVYGIVKNHGGFIEVQSTPGLGSTFAVYLPALATRPIILPRSSNHDLALPKLHGRILLVDDHELVRNVSTSILETLGYSVRSARDGIEAIDIFHTAPNAFDLAILDVVMPRMGGRECLYELRKFRPDMPVILASGYAQDHLLEELTQQPNVHFIKKPFSVEELTRTLTKLMPVSSDASVNQ